LITIKTPEEINIMKEGGKILAVILRELKEMVKPGITTKNIEKKAEELLSRHKVDSAFLNYGGFPSVLCASVNEEVVHCVPNKKELKNGDLLSIDMGLIYKGFNLDSAVTVPVIEEGEYWNWAALNPQKEKLIQVTKKALELGIKEIKPGRRTGVVSSVIQKLVENNNFNIVKELTGHGIGRRLHEDPQIPNFGSKNEGPIMKEGMVIAVEPIVSVGDWRIKEGDDGHSYVTKDRSLTAHFEHTVAILKDGPIILTKE